MQELKVEIDAASLRALLGKSSSFDRAQKAQLRKALRQAGEESRRAVQAAARKPGQTKGRSPRSRGLRARIASGTRVAVLSGSRRAGVQVVTKAPLAQAWAARKGWRHPVYGDADTWAKQVGNPGYFRDAIYGRRNATRRAVEQAMRDTLRTMGS
jgi:hypothetical protein